MESFGTVFHTLLVNVLSYMFRLSPYEFCFPPNRRRQSSQVLCKDAITFDPVPSNMLLISETFPEEPLMSIFVPTICSRQSVFFCHAPQNSFSPYSLPDSKECPHLQVFICYSSTPLVVPTYVFVS